jgi:UDP-N-acetyl-D-mannosaminuronate dehydrogenase
MWQRPEAVAKRIMTALCCLSEQPRVLVIGAGFKKGQSLTTHAPGVDLIKALQSLNAEVSFVDPLVEQKMLPFVSRFDHSTRWTKEALEQSFDYIVIAVNQDGLNYGLLEEIELPVEHFSR